MLTKVCTKCGIEKSLDEFYRKISRKDKVDSWCKSCHSDSQRSYYKENADSIKNNTAEYRRKNIDRCREKDREYRRKNKVKQQNYSREYREVNKDNLRIKRHSPVVHSLYSERIGSVEEIRAHKELLEVRCAYCNKWFAPKLTIIKSRLSALNNLGRGECRLYCSNECKQACPTFKKVKYESGRELSTSREVPAEFRKMALEDRDYTCEKCGSKEGGLHVHHIEGYAEQPMLRADLCNVLVVCKKCHKEIHKQPGCSYSDYGLCKIG